jgi:hypothetical protein
MKLLKGQTERVEKDGIAVDVKVITTAMQARLSEMSIDSSMSGRVKMIGFILNNCVESVEVDGSTYDPRELAEKADISDKGTLEAMLKISAMVANVAFPTAEEAKK